MPIMQGTIQIEECEIEGYQFDFVLISRRSRERAGWLAIITTSANWFLNKCMYPGMRYQRRGINEQGEVANFVETEQAVIFYVSNTYHVMEICN